MCFLFLHFWTQCFSFGRLCCDCTYIHIVVKECSDERMCLSEPTKCSDGLTDARGILQRSLRYNTFSLTTPQIANKTRTHLRGLSLCCDRMLESIFNFNLSGIKLIKTEIDLSGVATRRRAKW